MKSLPEAFRKVGKKEFIQWMMASQSQRSSPPSSVVNGLEWRELHQEKKPKKFYRW